MAARVLGLTLALALALAAVRNCEAKPFKMPWTTDEALIYNFPDALNGTKGRYGPDGPWQAVALLTISGDLKKGVLVPVWPNNAEVTELVTTAIGGAYSPNRTASLIPYEEDGHVGHTQMKNFDPWLSAYFGSYDTWGMGYRDNVTLLAFQDEDVNVNASILAASVWNVRMANGLNYTGTVGNLGLGPLSPTLSAPMKKSLVQKGIVEQLADEGTVDSNFWSLHMGSVMTNQIGSLVLGGYEKNRALGTLGAFDIADSVASLFLLDVTLGVEEGLSPFNVSAPPPGSIWPGVQGERGSQMTRLLGGKAGSAVMAPNPGSPGIYLPTGTCENAAKHLPVTYDNKTGYYLWNTADPSYDRIVSSPAYLGFTFADRTATNLTIKVPMQLLNLTLESPIVDKPTPYFPCHSLDSELGFWALGRAFLQAAFLGISYDQGLLFLAQAPGPHMDQSVIESVTRNDATFDTNPIDTFRDTWSTHWTVLSQDDDNDQGTASDSDSSNSDSSATTTTTTSGLTTAAKAGIAVGITLAFLLLAAAAFFLWRRRRQAAEQQQQEQQQLEDSSMNEIAAHVASGGGGDKDSLAAATADKQGATPEMDPDSAIYEMGQPQYRHEMGQPVFRHEVDGNSSPAGPVGGVVYYEAPGYCMAVELPAEGPGHGAGGSPPPAYRSPTVAGNDGVEGEGVNPFEAASEREGGQQAGGVQVGDGSNGGAQVARRE